MLIWSDDKDDPKNEPADGLLQEIETMQVNAKLRKLKSIYPLDADGPYCNGWGVLNSRTPSRRPARGELEEAIYVKSTNVIFLDDQDVVLPEGTFFRVGGKTTEEIYTGEDTKPYTINRVLLTALHPDDSTQTVNYALSTDLSVAPFEVIQNEMTIIAIATTGI